MAQPASLPALGGRALGRLARLPGLRRLRPRDRTLLRLAMVSAAVEVTDPLRFALNELWLRRGVRTYTLRSSGRRISLRHPASDAWVIHEVFRRGAYRPPPEVRDVLASAPGPLRILDLGAHVGSSSLSFLETFPDALVTGFEPNPETASLLRRTVGLNGLTGRWEVREAAVGVADGTARIEGFSLLAHLSREREELEAVDRVPALRDLQPAEPPSHEVRVEDALPLLAATDLAKLDIEGSEWPILADPRFPGPCLRALVLEYHPQGAPGRDSTREVRRLLSAAGFDLGEPYDVHDGVGLLWAWRSGTAAQPASSA